MYEIKLAPLSEISEVQEISYFFSYIPLTNILIL
jgi:hypothetical protein